jgi:dinuclear metal center YbgI/SA1388 family protein
MSTVNLELEFVISYLDELLGLADFPDYPGAANGLQVLSSGSVTRIGAAVDAGLATIEAAARREVSLLLVHHGLFWKPLQPLTGTAYNRVRSLIQSDMALYSAHLPLDAHPDFGNAACLIRALGLEPGAPFAGFEGRHLGFETETSTSRDSFRDLVSETVAGPVTLLPGGPEEVRRIGVVTGGGGSFIEAASSSGLDTLLTGEGAHHTFLDAMELGVNVLYAGHYATETWGVKALAAHLESRFGLPWEFFDFPSGL